MVRVTQARRPMSHAILSQAAQGSTSLGLLTRDELAAELKCSPRHIMRLTARRVIPRVVISARCVRYRRDAVLVALTRREQEAMCA